jgi:hypothetical protein
MVEDPEVFLVPVGKLSRNVQAKLCEVGFVRLLERKASLYPRKVKKRSPIDPRRVYRHNYIHVRYCDAVTGNDDLRQELGRWLLNSGLIPVAHLNGDPLDFRLENLVARETAAKREKREAAAARRNAKRIHRPENKPDGLTPKEQEEKLCSADFQNLLLRTAGSYVRDQMQCGTYEKPTDDKRAPEIVARVVAEAIPYIRRGKVRDVAAYAYSAVRTQARVELGRMLGNLGHVAKSKISL